ncbi:lycopene cyclase family protein [Corynebacterium choanae]|uniref:Lycopene beta cyclase n=1 Tax=Corynebacterium choanae TaxID=1862358 RepID=A0A3G6JAU4_9CORY|nr:lycopene cyclase family protein [Corynebacterium choanae]AZA13610.1 Lycopene beta cyclase [Corynebacterium choanae]
MPITDTVRHRLQALLKRATRNQQALPGRTASLKRALHRLAASPLGCVDYPVIVLGAGPAGSALHAALRRRSIASLLIDPYPVMRNTYGIFADEIPSWLDKRCIAAVTKPVVVTADGDRFPLGRKYCLLDNAALASQLQAGDLLEHPATIVDAHTVQVGEQTLRAALIIDARGNRLHPMANQRREPTLSESKAVEQVYQLASGVLIPQHVLDESGITPPAVWMDFQPPHAHSLPDDCSPTFGYIMPHPAGILVEETILATAQPPTPELFDTLTTAACERARRYIPTLVADQLTPVEQVCIPLLAPTGTAVDGAIPIGAAAGWINPVTGYSVATSFRLADLFAAAIANPTADQRRRLVGTLHQLSVDRWLLTAAVPVLLALNRRQLDTFLRPVLCAPQPVQRAFLTLGDLSGTLRGMWQVFIRQPLPLQGLILRHMGTRPNTGANSPLNQQQLS